MSILLGNGEIRQDQACEGIRGRILIVTPTLGTSNYFADSVSSIEAMGLTQVDHVVVCPAPQIQNVRSIARQSTTIPETANTMYGAINDAAQFHTTWRWLTYLNDDDFFLPPIGELIHQIEAELDHTQPTIVYSRVQYVMTDGSPICEFPIQRDSRRLSDCYRIACNPIATHGTFVSRSAYELLNGFDAEFRYAGDMDFFVRALKNQVRFVYLPFLATSFRLHGDNLTTHVEAFGREEHVVREKLSGTIGGLKARQLRLSFVYQNWRSYWQRLRSIRRLRIVDFLQSQVASA